MEQAVFSPESLGAALKRARKAQKLSQKAAGFPFQIEQSTISNIENGVPGTRLDTLFRMLAALDLEIVIRSKEKIDKPKGENW